MQSMSLPAQTITNSVSPYMFTNANTYTCTKQTTELNLNMAEFTKLN